MVGQSAFVDLNLDGQLSMIFPACPTPQCDESVLYHVALKSLWEDPVPKFNKLQLSLNGWK